MYAYIRLKTRGEVAWTGLCACCLFQVSVNIYCTEVEYIHTGILTIRANLCEPQAMVGTHGGRIAAKFHNNAFELGTAYSNSW